MDSFYFTLEDIAKDIKVGIPYTFKGEAGLDVDNLELYVDGFRIGEAGFGRPSAGKKLWELTYKFTGQGKRSLVMSSKSGIDVISNRFHSFVVAPKEEVNPTPKPTSAIKIVESDIQHIARWNNKLIGVVLHYSAGRQIEDARGLLELGVKNGYTYWALNSKGVFHKTHELNEFGYHVGMYRHKNHLGVEIMCPGKLTPKDGEFYPWYDLRTPWPKDQVRYFEGSETQVRGHYAKFTNDQEEAIIELVRYLKKNCPEFNIDNVVSHDECMAEIGLYGEKQDVGGSLSRTMPELREYLKRVIV